jgi:hypothetical protein
MEWAVIPYRGIMEKVRQKVLVRTGQLSGLASWKVDFPAGHISGSGLFVWALAQVEWGIGASFPNAFWIVLQGYTALENVGIPRIACPLVGSWTGVTVSIGPSQLESKLQAETP